MAAFNDGVERLCPDYTPAYRALALMELAKDSLARGDGKLARLQATAARDYLRRHFPSAQRRARVAAGHIREEAQ